MVNAGERFANWDQPDARLRMFLGTFVPNGCVTLTNSWSTTGLYPLMDCSALPSRILPAGLNGTLNMLLIEFAILFAINLYFHYFSKGRCTTLLPTTPNSIVTTDSGIVGTT